MAKLIAIQISSFTQAPACCRCMCFTHLDDAPGRSPHVPRT
jgi:hypothetical protein